VGSAIRRRPGRLGARRRGGTVAAVVVIVVLVGIGVAVAVHVASGGRAGPFADLTGDARPTPAAALAGIADRLERLIATLPRPIPLPTAIDAAHDPGVVDRYVRQQKDLEPVMNLLLEARSIVDGIRHTQVTLSDGENAQLRRIRSAVSTWAGDDPTWTTYLGPP
jgi:hypothetical protein